MSNRIGAVFVTAFALAALAGSAFAEDKMSKPKHHAPPPSGWREVSDDFFVGRPPDPGSDNRYFSDTKQPKTENLGPTIFGRWE